jgi:hypothetical protein
MKGRWSPSPAQISVAIDCAIARMPIARAAELLGIGPRTLWIFTRRLDPSIFAAWRDRPRYLPVSRGSGGSLAAISPAGGHLSRPRRYMRGPLGRRGHPMTPRLRQPIHGASLAAWSKRRPWRARVYIAGEERSLGYFATKEEARAAHAEAVKRHLGEAYLKRGAAEVRP